MAQGFVADTGDFNFLFEVYNRNTCATGHGCAAPWASRSSSTTRASPTAAHAALAAAPMQFDDEMTEVRRPAPGLGEHTEEVLAELGRGGEDIAALRTAGAIA